MAKSGEEMIYSLCSSFSNLQCQIGNGQLLSGSNESSQRRDRHNRFVKLAGELCICVCVPSLKKASCGEIRYVRKGLCRFLSTPQGLARLLKFQVALSHSHPRASRRCTFCRCRRWRSEGRRPRTLSFRRSRSQRMERNPARAQTNKSMRADVTMSICSLIPSSALWFHFTEHSKFRAARSYRCHRITFCLASSILLSRSAGIILPLCEEKSMFSHVMDCCLWIHHGEKKS